MERVKGTGTIMKNALAMEMYEMFLEDYDNAIKCDFKSCPFIGFAYADTYDYEDEYCHNDVEEAREIFIDKVNEFFKEKNLPYMIREVVDNAYVCDKDGNILRE